jgi:hypothetical protein
MIPPEVKAEIRRLREVEGLKVNTIARLLGVHHSTVSAVFEQARMPTSSPPEMKRRPSILDPICARLGEVGKLNPGHAGGPTTPAGVLPLRTDGSHTAVGPQDARLIEAWRGCDRPSTPAFWVAVGAPASPDQRGRSGG